MNGKGSRPRSRFSQQFRDNYDHIFRRGKRKKVAKTYTVHLNVQAPKGPGDPLGHSPFANHEPPNGA